MSTRYTYEQPEYLDVEGAKFLVAEIKEYIDLKITGGVDLSTYATKDYVDNAVSNVNVDLSSYATKEYVDNAIANSGGSTGDGTDSGETDEGGGETTTPSEDSVTLSINGVETIKYGGFTRTYKAVYINEDSTDVTSNYTTTWTITPTSGTITLNDIGVDTSTDNQIKLIIEDESGDFLGSTFTLTATSSDTSISPVSKEITVVEPF